MSRPNQRLDTADDAAAYRVASLLRQPPPSASRNTSDTDSLRSMTAQIEQFLAMAPQVPPVRMEPEWSPSGGNEEEEAEAERELLRGPNGQPVVQLNVVAGVLEETGAEESPSGTSSNMTRVNGVLLPTAANQQELHRRKVEQAQAMLNLMSALTPSPAPRVAASDMTASKEEAATAQASPNLSTQVMQHASSNSDSDNEEVAVMDADDLNDEDTSDDDMPAQRRRIQEMN